MKDGNLLTVLIDWLQQRAMPNSGIDYLAAEVGHGTTRGRQARVTVYGTDATFVVDHLHGKGARDLAAALAGQCADAIGRLCDLLVNTGTLEPASVLEALGLREWSARPVEGDQP